jgi:tRNA modification GTPase
MASGDLQRDADQSRLTPTIFALATGTPPTAIAVVRVSGPATMAIVRRLTGRPLPLPRRLTRRTLRDPATDVDIDAALVAVFPGPASVTGDDVAELHLHGGVAIVGAVLATLRRHGAVPATAGAFTRRAFDNGKIDLGQVEALGDLIAAETDGQRRSAMSRTGSDLARRVDRWRAVLIDVRADLEATLDFAEDDDVGTHPMNATDDRLTALAHELIAVRAQAERGGRLRDGVTVAIVGPVNAGKSTLLNALARRDVALVSPMPGTTRDVIEVRIDLGGILVTIIDTAGVRDTTDDLEIAGISRGQIRAETADIIVALGPTTFGNAIEVVSKSDLAFDGAGWRDGALHLSATTGDGIDLLEAHLAARVVALTDVAEPALVAAQWQVAALDDAIAAIGAAQSTTVTVVIAEELRRVTVALERLIGRVSSETLLDQVFTRFCIGK